MSYCTIGDTPKVIFTRKGESAVSYFETKYSPIDVSIGSEDISYTGQKFNASGFTINYSDGTKQTVVDYRYGSQPNTIQFWSCGGTDWDNRQPDGSYPVTYPLNGKTVSSIDTSTNCPVSPGGVNCVLRVRYEGREIFSASVACGSNFEVACSGKCPPGYCQKTINEYPGYCCCNCAAMKAEIASVRNLVRANG